MVDFTTEVPVEFVPERGAKSDLESSLGSIDATTTMAGATGPGSDMPSLAEDRNRILEDILDTLERSGGGGGGVGGAVVTGSTLGSVARGGVFTAGAVLNTAIADATAGFAGDQGDRVDDAVGVDPGPALQAFTRLNPVTAPAVAATNAAALGEGISALASADLPSQDDLPPLPAPDAEDLPEIPGPESDFFPELPEPQSVDYWPTIPQPEDIGVDIPDELQDLADALTGGDVGGSTRPNSSVPSNLMNPGESGGSQDIGVDISDFTVDLPSGREIERELESAVIDIVEDYLEREIGP